MHDGARVVELSAVVGRGEEGDERPLVEELVAVLDDLVRAHDEAEVVLGQEGVDHVGAEAVAHAAVAGLPAGCLLRIG